MSINFYPPLGPPRGSQTLSSYDVVSRETGKPKAVGDTRFFETAHQRSWPQLKLFPLDEAGWLKALKLEGYALRRPAGPIALQETLFPTAGYLAPPSAALERHADAQGDENSAHDAVERGSGAYLLCGRACSLLETLASKTLP